MFPRKNHIDQAIHASAVGAVISSLILYAAVTLL